MTGAVRQPGSGRDRQAAGERTAVALVAVLVSAAVLLAVAREETFFLRDDLQNQFLGGYAEIVRALKAGELPLLTQLSWQASALAGEYQYGLFNPVHTALNLLLFSLELPLPYLGMAHVWIYSLILSYGAYVLARSKRLSPQLSLMVALATSLNGWMALWGVNWLPALSSFAWLPWTWCALHRAVARRGDAGSVVLAGILVALIFTSGWPYTCLMAMLVAAMLVAELPLALGKSPRAALPVVWSVLVGLGLSAPAWLMLIEYSRSTVRAMTQSPLTLQTEFMLPFKAYFATILPTLTAYWNIPWQLSEPTASTTMHLGLAPVVMLAAAFLVLRSRLFRELSYDWLFLLILLILASLPSLGMFRWSFRWLPLLFLQTALVAGSADRLLRHRAGRRPRYGATAFLLVSAASIYSIFVDVDRTPSNLRFCAGLIVLSALWWLLDRGHRFPGWRRHLPWLVVFSTSMWVGMVLFKGVPHDPRRHETWEEKLFDPSVTYLALYGKKEYWGASIRVFGERFFPGNEHMHPRLRFVNGYSPMTPAGPARIFGLNYIGAIHRPPAPNLGAILRRAAVDGLVVWPDSPHLDRVPLDEFEKVAATPEFEVYHRRSAPTPRVQIVPETQLAVWAKGPPVPRRAAWPLVERRGPPRTDVVKFGTAELEVVADGRLSVVVDVDARQAQRPVLISFARPWVPGYRASVNGEAAEVMRLDRLMPVVTAPPGRHSRVVLRYRPWSWVVGLILCGATLSATLWVLILQARRGRRAADRAVESIKPGSRAPSRFPRSSGTRERE